MSQKASKRETNAVVLRQAMIRRLPRRLAGNAEFSLPPVPALLEHFVKLFDTQWADLGRKFNEAELEQFRKSLKARLEQAWEASALSRVLVSYRTDPPPKSTITWKVSTVVATISDEYQHWVETRTPPLFGKHADAKAVEVARSLGAPSEVTILDVGAGTGRNAIPLAREGFQVDAVEPAAPLCKILRETVTTEALSVGVVEASILDTELTTPRPSYRMLLLSEVVASHFRSVEQLRQLFTTAVRLLEPGGVLLFNAFLTDSGYKPDDLARQLSQVLWSALFTRRDLDQAAQDLPLHRQSDESALEFERAHLPADQWPPTGWFEGWSGGQDLFDLPAQKPPFELRWLVYRKSA
jgi:2-polyprenyl-3-methyl-5-hydroxy-6-metoxy-1,4-benzoquinol methylase